MSSNRISWCATLLAAVVLAAIVWTNTSVASAHHAAATPLGAYNNWALVNGGSVSVCNQTTNAGTGASHFASGTSMWTSVGGTIAFVSCTNPQVIFANDPGMSCGNPPVPSGQWVGCAFSPNSDTQTTGFQAYLGASLAPLSDNKKIKTVGHELGHVFNLDHAGNCGFEVMAQGCEPTTLTALDIGRFRGIYNPPAPLTIGGNSPGVGQVTLNWSYTDDSHSEKAFAAYRLDGGNWTLLSTVSIPRNATSVTFGGQPGGNQYYGVGPTTAAGCYPTGGLCGHRDMTSPVNVQPGANFEVVSANPSAGVTMSEGTSQAWTLTIRNSGTANAPPFAVRVEFGSATSSTARPNPEGVCAFNSGMAAGGQLQCTTIAVNANWGGTANDSVVIKMDYLNQVTETNETDNVSVRGALSITPQGPIESPDNDVVTWPAGGSLVCGAVGGDACYAWKDRSAIEKSSGGYKVQIQRKLVSGTTTCSSSSYSNWNDEISYSGVSGTGTTTFDDFDPVGTSSSSTGYCYRIRVRAVGPTGESSWVTDSQPQFYP